MIKLNNASFSDQMSKSSTQVILQSYLSRNYIQSSFGFFAAVGTRIILRGVKTK